MLVQVLLAVLSGMGPFLKKRSGWPAESQVITIATAKIGWALVLLVFSPCACGLSNAVIVLQFLSEGRHGRA